MSCVEAREARVAFFFRGEGDANTTLRVSEPEFEKFLLWSPPRGAFLGLSLTQHTHTQNTHTHTIGLHPFEPKQRNPICRIFFFAPFEFGKRFLCRCSSSACQDESHVVRLQVQFLVQCLVKLPAARHCRGLEFVLFLRTYLFYGHFLDSRVRRIYMIWKVLREVCSVN